MEEDGPGAPESRQHKLDRAQGLVPLSVKLNGELVKKLHALAEEAAPLNEVVTQLLEKGLRE